MPASPALGAVRGEVAALPTPATVTSLTTSISGGLADVIAMARIASGAIGAFASLDLFFFYAFHELALIPTFLLIGIWGSGNRFAAAWKVTIYLGLGSFVLLLGLILLYRSVPTALRSFDLRALQAVAPELDDVAFAVSDG